jgi:histone demethylase
MSLKHFRLAEDDAGPCTFASAEIRFHTAHLHEVKGDSAKAKEIYEDLLKEPNLSSNLKADIFRQLGWMYHSVEAFGDKPTRIPQAIQYLNKSIDADGKSGQSLYLLGRCYAAIGKVHEAFIAYRNSVDKSESNNADTWCSIGVLYQQQNQPMDALQAYICAVQLDKDHAEAWTNLGILYESANQPQDAMTCFNNASRKRALPANLVQRIKYLKSQLSTIPPPITAKPKQLPSVEDAWNSQVSNEMTNRQPAKGANKEGSPQKSLPVQQPQPRPPFYLTQQQLATLQYLQNQPSLVPQQQQILLQLQQQFRLMQQHQQAARQQQQRQQFEQQQAAQQVSDLLSDLQNKDLGSVSDKELEDLISQQDIGSFAESLLKQIQVPNMFLA